EAVWRAGDRLLFAKDLVLALDFRTAAGAGVVERVIAPRPPVRPDRVIWGPVRPVMVPGCQVGDRDAPELLADCVALGQRAPLVVGRAQLAQIVGRAVAGDIERGQAARCAHDLDDATILRGDPGRALVVVIA